MTWLVTQDITLKAAVRCLIDKNGGIDGAAAVCRLRRAQLANCASNASAQMLPIDVLWRLERAAKAHDVTSALAAVLGMVLVPRAAVAAPSGPHDLLTLAARVGSEAGDVLKAALEGVADGALTAAELSRLSKELDEATAAIGRARDAVSAEQLRRQNIAIAS